MSTTVPNLDKTLDDIIGTSKPRASGRSRSSRGKKTSGGVSKKSAAPKKDVAKLKDESTKETRQQTKKAKADDPFHQAVKITVSNFPVDITESKLKEFLHNDIGAVKNCEGVYARNGKPTGKFTVEFRDEGKALAAFNKLNGMPMDGGAKILAVEIHTDPTRKSLASRLGSIAPTKEQKQKQEPKKKAAAEQTPKKKRAAKKSTPKKRTPKSAEELDAEMDEYISQKDVISV